MTKVIMISRDVKALDESSIVFGRLKEYSNLFDGLYVVVMGRRSTFKSLHSERLCIYNATSSFKIFSFIKTFFKTLLLARKNKAYVTWISSQDPFESGLLAFIIAKIAKIKLQLQIHTDCFNTLFIKHSLANYFRALIARLIVIRADSIRVVSERIKSSLLVMSHKLLNHIHILPIWTDIEEIRSKRIIPELDLRIKFPEFTKIILVVARLESEKNIELSIHAFQKMLRFNKSLGLVIAGTGSKEKWLRELVKYLGIDSNVKFLGWVSEVSSLYKTSDLLLVTSYYEGYGLNIVESIVCGTPVVSTDVGIARDTGAVMVPYDAGQIALKSIEILKQNNRVELSYKFVIGKLEYLDKFKNTFI